MWPTRRRRYGTPLPPGRRRSLLDLRFPRSLSELLGLLRSRRFLTRGGALISVLIIGSVIFGSATSQAPLPPLDRPGAPLDLSALTLRLPANWSLAKSDDLSLSPLVLFAPQRNLADPPTTISLAIVDVTGDAKKLLSDDLTVDEAHLRALSDYWAARAKRGPSASVSTRRYNVQSDTSGLVPLALRVDWQNPVPWTPPSPAVLTPSPTPTPTAVSAGATDGSATSLPDGATPRPTIGPSPSPTLPPAPVGSLSGTTYTRTAPGLSLTVPGSSLTLHSLDEVGILVGGRPPIGDYLVDANRHLAVAAFSLPTATIADLSGLIDPRAGRTIADQSAGGLDGTLVVSQTGDSPFVSGAATTYDFLAQTESQPVVIRLVTSADSKLDGAAAMTSLLGSLKFGAVEGGGAAVASGPALHQIIWFALPAGVSFRDNHRVRAIVVTLSYPAVADATRTVELGRALDLLTDSIVVP